MLYYTDDSWVPECAVFDCDGILIDSEKTWNQVQKNVFARYEVELSEELEAELEGSSALTVATAIAERSLPSGATLEQHQADVLETLLAVERELISGGVDLIPGAQEIMAKLASVMPVAVASNSTDKILKTKVETYGYAQYLKTYVSSSDVVNPKPAPDMYLEAVKRLGGSPENAVTFEDSNAGATAAMDAGTRTFVFVRDADSPEGAPRGKGYFSSFEDPDFVALVDSWVAARSLA